METARRSSSAFPFRFSHAGLLLLILLAAVSLRVLDLNKTDGLWLDEIMSARHADQAFPAGILRSLYQTDYHAPLYYFILHFWMKWAGSGDVACRWLSVLLGVLTVPVGYLAGRELSGKWTGCFAAALVGANSLLIYYSQEVRFYSLLGLLGALAALFLIKTWNSNGWQNFAMLSLVNLCILYTSTTGFVFVVIEVTVFCAFLLLNKAHQCKQFLLFQFLVLILFLPFVPALVHFHSKASRSPIGIFSWTSYDASSVLVAFQDWFSPILKGIYNNPPDYLHNLAASALTGDLPHLLFGLLLPAVIAFWALIRAGLAKGLPLCLLLTAAGFVAAQCLAASVGASGFLARYTIIVLPLVLLCLAHGIVSLKNSKWAILAASLFLFVQLAYLAASPFSAFRLPRREGLKCVSDALGDLGLNARDFIIMPYGGAFLGRYYPTPERGERGEGSHGEAFQGRDYPTNAAAIVPLDIISFKDEPLAQHPYFDPAHLKGLNKDTAYQQLKPYLADPAPSAVLTDWLKSNVIERLNENGRVAVVLAPAMKVFDEKTLPAAVANERAYLATPMLDLLGSKMSIDILNVNASYLKLVSVKKIGVWTIVLFKV